MDYRKLEEKETLNWHEYRMLREHYRSLRAYGEMTEAQYREKMPEAELKFLRHASGKDGEPKRDGYHDEVK